MREQYEISYSGLPPFKLVDLFQLPADSYSTVYYGRSVFYQINESGVQHIIDTYKTREIVYALLSETDIIVNIYIYIYIYESTSKIFYFVVVGSLA